MRDLTRKLYIVVALVAVAMFATATQARYITGGAHDFGATGWSGTETCGPCHTPHNGNTSVTEAPLWAHTLTTATTYEMNIGGVDTTGLSAANDVDPESRLCLSCHDGTVALDSFMGSTAPSGTLMTGNALFGTDLTNDHPIGAAAIWQGTPTLDGSGNVTSWSGENTSSFVSQNTYTSYTKTLTADGTTSTVWATSAPADGGGYTYAVDLKVDGVTPVTASTKLKVKAMPATSSFAGKFAVSCVTCHRAHTGSQVVKVNAGGVTPDGATVNGSLMCLSCHAK